MMRQELDARLCQRYSDVFRDRHGEKTETGMCWGFGCGDGWFDIIDGLCTEITSQVKEKAGYLRFYIHGHCKRDENQEAYRLAVLARQKAERACKQCRRPVGCHQPLMIGIQSPLS